MVAETPDLCDWCYGPLSANDLASTLGRTLALIEAGACADCVAARRVTRPPDSLNAQAVSLSGDEAWSLAVGSLMSGSDEEAAAAAADTLRKIAGYRARLRE
jgi:hypothetical protein